MHGEVLHAHHLFANLSYYKDNGEVEDALLFTTAAPETTSRRAGLGLRWTRGDWSAQAYYAPVSTRFDNTNVNSQFFENLYSDRDWSLAKFAIRKTF